MRLPSLFLPGLRQREAPHDVPGANLPGRVGSNEKRI
jgi:hypothetical protein